MITFRKLGIEGARFGNQLSQYAALIGVATKNGYDYCIPYDNISRKGGLLDLNTGKWIEVTFRLPEAFNLSAKKLTPEIDNQILNTFEEDISKFVYSDDLFKIKDNTNIHGFFQCEKYWLHCESIIRNEFKFKFNIFNQAKHQIDNIRKNYKLLISVHIRHGDYLGNQLRYNILPSKYYQDAINTLSPDLGDDFAFLIFSDNIEWCKNIFGEDLNIFYIENNKDLVDLCMMTLCDYNIIANSTFSWWGAWLNNSNNKKVIAPKNWFGPELAYLNQETLYCRNWIVI